MFYQFYFYYGSAHKLWLFEKFIFELEASYIFKNTCILLKMLICLKENGGVINKTFFTPLILESILMEKGNMSATVI